MKLGMRAVAVQRLLGHKDVSVTLNTYTTIFDKYNELNSIKALEYIRENYLEKEVKVDPIIFDIFSSFICGENKLIA